jgi:hypothetical protein
MIKKYWVYILLAFSLSLNLGGIGATAYHAIRSGHFPSLSQPQEPNVYLSDYLNLASEQRRIWREKGQIFWQEIAAAWPQIQVRREAMVRAIFSANPDPAVIEAERAAIGGLQEQVQRAAIRHMLDESAMLDSKQREALTELLIRQGTAGALDIFSWRQPHHD